VSTYVRFNTSIPSQISGHLHLEHREEVDPISLGSDKDVATRTHSLKKKGEIQSCGDGNWAKHSTPPTIMIVMLARKINAGESGK